MCVSHLFFLFGLVECQPGDISSMVLMIGMLMNVSSFPAYPLPWPDPWIGYCLCEWFFGCTQWCSDIEVGWMEGVSTEFENSLWDPLSSTVYWCMVGDDSIITCAIIIFLNGNSLLMNSGGVKNEFVDHSCVCRTLSFSISQLGFPSVLLFSAMLLVILGQ